MPVVDTTITFQNNDQVTASKLNAIMDNSSFVSAAVVAGNGLEVVGGQLKIGDGSNGITTAKLADLSVTTAKIANSNVTTEKIADANVTPAKLSNSDFGAFTVASGVATLAANSVATSKITDANVTAAKLDGAQTGTAPIYGVRAWVNFNGVGGAVIREKGNVSSVTRNSPGLYTITFSTAMPDTNYSIVGWARDPGSSGGSACVVTAGSSATKTTTSFQVRTAVGTTQPDSPEINIMVIR